MVVAGRRARRCRTPTRLFQNGKDYGGGVLFCVVEAFGGFLEIARGGFEYVDEFLGVAVC